MQQTNADPKYSLAIEDSVEGVQSAVRAGIPVVGINQFTPNEQKVQHAALLQEHGAFTVVADWSQMKAVISDWSSSR